MLPLTQVLMSAVGWRTTWLILGIAVAAIVIPLNALFLHRRPEDRGLFPDGDPEPIRLPNSTEPVESSWTLGLALRTRAFWMVLLATNLSGSGIIGVLVNQVAYLKEFYSDGWAVGGATLVTASSLVGRFGWLLVADRINPRYSAAISFLLSAAGMLFFLYADNVVMMVLWGLSFGVGIGGMDPMTSLLWARFFGRRFIGSIRGFVTMTNMVSIAGSPLLVAAIFEATGTYRPAFLVLLAAFLASRGIYPSIPGPRGAPSENKVLYIFHGEDDFTRREALARLAESLDAPEALATNTSKLDGSDLSYDRLMSIINAMPFLAEHRLVIVQGLLSKSNPPDRQRTGSSAAQRQRKGSKEAAQWDQLPNAVKVMPPTTVLVSKTGPFIETTHCLRLSLPRPR